MSNLSILHSIQYGGILVPCLKILKDVSLNSAENVSAVENNL